MNLKRCFMLKKMLYLKKTIHTKTHAATSTTIDWKNGNKASHNCSGNTTYSFDDPTQNELIF